MTGVTINVYALFLTGPPSPQNITVGPITDCQVSVRWMLTDEQLQAGWTFTVHYVDMFSRQEKIVGMTNISKLSEIDGLQSYSAMIGGLESYRKYRIKVFTVTQWGIESCEHTPVTVQTGKHIKGPLQSRHFSLSQWDNYRCKVF